jgi:hypothetical protein
MLVLLGLMSIFFQCQQSKQETVILKLDFTKVFDTIEHVAITQMMRSLGFSSN